MARRRIAAVLLFLTASTLIPGAACVRGTGAPATCGGDVTGGDSSVAAHAQANRVVRFAAIGDAAAGEETVIITSPVSVAARHNGGNVHFGPDGKLYVTLGEIFDSSNSQKLDVLPGRILRLN